MSENDRSTIAGYAATLSVVALGADAIALYTVADLESRVDRGAILRGEADPPYWASLWTGARVLAAYVAHCVPTTGRRVLELGCGLGLTGLVAARRGAEVLLVDEAEAALAFVTASAEANRVSCETLCADFTTLPVDRTFDLILAAEVAYDPPTFVDLAATITRQLAADGAALVADAYRTDTRALYRAFRAAGLAAHAIDLRVPEEGHPIQVRLTVLRHRKSTAERAERS